MNIPTTQTPENIAMILEVLAGIPARLETITSQLSPNQLTDPIGPGERTPTEILAHILNCETVIADAITLALLKKEPLLPGLHPERHLGKLLNLQRFPFEDLLTYFNFRRRVLLDILQPLSETQWSRTVQEEGKQRRESIYRLSRVQALHENEHLTEIEEVLLG